MTKDFNLETKDRYYILSNAINKELIAIKNKNWTTFANNSSSSLSSKKCWNRIKSLKNKNATFKDNYPKMIFNNITHKTDEEKANLFANLLGETFKNNDDEI